MNGVKRVLTVLQWSVVSGQWPVVSGQWPVPGGSGGRGSNWERVGDAHVRWYNTGVIRDS